MVLLEHLPLIGLALSLAHHHNHARSSHHHPSLPNHKPAAQISADASPFHQAPKLIAARASDEAQETTIQVSQHHLQTILDKIKTLEEEIFNMMSSKADSSLNLGSTPARYASKDSAATAPAKAEKLVVTTHEPETNPAVAIFGGLFKEASVGLDTPAISDDKSTTIITSTTRITRTVTVVPTGIVTVTTFPSHLAMESNLKALIPFVNATADADPPRTTLSIDTLSGHRVRLLNLSSISTSTSTSTGVDAERGRPTITAMAFNASASFHRVSLSAASSGFRTLRRAA
ncbi:uncharacterized protein Triagg1_7124 [Trichoderma aggressivum f. europaeum]|uniref:Uncharacterized protein n=1 Tax=Trichoderma aggressivum f. europaeum TaxID=173218 RepID=A0AAE1J6D6_9HYPO|nr:hypothetical protein Triagg1_7124 [Trichoderma aggressivum f. europaeum]